MTSEIQTVPAPGLYADLKTQFGWVNGDYDWITEIITIAARQGVPDTDNADDLELIEIDRDTWSMEQGRADIAARGYLPATFREGLVYARQYPNCQMERPYNTFATELVVHRRRIVPCFDYGALLAVGVTDGWDRDILCLVRKIPT